MSIMIDPYRFGTVFDPAALYTGGAGGGGYGGEWIEARNDAGNWQDSAGTIAAAVDNPIGKAGDLSPNLKHVAQSTSGSRPMLRVDGNGKKRFALDGVDDFLQHNAATGYAAGVCSIFATVAGVPGITNVAVGEGNAGLGQYCPIRAGASAASSLQPYLRNDAGTAILNAVRATNAFLSTPTVVGVVDTGSQLTGYVNGVAGTSAAYTRSGALAGMSFLVGSRQSNGSSHFTGYIYNVFKVDRVLTPTEIGQLVTYLGAQAGLLL